MDRPAGASGAARGLQLAGFSFIWWGLAPLYFRLIHHIHPGVVLGWRLAGSCVLMAVIVAALGQLGQVRAALTSRILGLRLLLSGLLISVNWFMFIWLISIDRISEASLGYYMNPFVNIALGVVALGERFSRLQLAAILLAALGVAVKTIAAGGLPWFALALPVTFGLYGLVRKTTPVQPAPALTVETLVATPPALIWLWFASAGAPLTGLTALDLLVLAGTSVITVVPLMAYAASARSLTLSTLGLMQYIAPTLQLGIAVFLFGEPFNWADGVCFACIWAGLALYSAELLSRRASP